MRNKLSVVLLCTLLIGVFLAASLYGAADDPSQRTWFKQDRAPKYMIPFERPMGQKPNMTAPQIPLGLKDVQAAGNIAGYSTYDYQHNGSMGRQLVTDPVNQIIQFCWMAQDNKTIPGDRGIKWNAWIVAQGAYAAAQGGAMITNYYSGYTSIAVWDYGLGAVGAHTDPEAGHYNCWLYVDYTPAACLFSDIRVAQPDPEAEWYIDDMETIWPIVDVHHAGGKGPTETVVYMLTHVYEASEDMILYRSVGEDEYNMPNQFDNGTYIETVTDLSYTVVADPNSDRVAIVYTDDRRGEEEGSGSQTDLDVWYMLSTNQGATWDQTDRTDEGPLTNTAGRYCVSKYQINTPPDEDSLWRAYSDLSACWSPDGNLHIIWPARELIDKNTYENYKSRLIHWSTDIPNARIIAEARHTMKIGQNMICDAGVWNMYIAKPSISWCDDKLYSLWTQFGTRYTLNDCSNLGYANGELMLAVSNDNGLTWDNPTNLTDSPTPNCTDSSCESDHWSSMARYGMIYTGYDTLDILYVNDKSAGGIPQGEGIWCTNPVMHLRTPCRLINLAPKIAFEVSSYVDPTHTQPGVPLNTDMTIINIGNSLLTGELQIGYVDGSGWIGFEGGAQTAALSIPSGASNTQMVALTLNLGGVLTTNPSGWDAYIIAATDAQSTPDSIPVHLTVASDFDMPQDAILNTTIKNLKVFNTGRLGGDEDYATLGFPKGAPPDGDCDTVDQYPNTSCWLYDASPMISWLDGTDKMDYTTIWTQIFTEDRTWRPQTDLSVDYETNHTFASYTVCTSDSIFGCDVRLWFPNDGNDFVVGKMNFYLWDACPVDIVEDVNIGFITDWDIPADSNVDNGSGYLDTMMIRGNDTSYISTLWNYGAEYHVDNEGICDIAENDRFGGIVFLNGQFKNGWTSHNSPVQQGSSFRRGFLYDEMIKTGFNKWTQPDRDSLIDLHAGVTFETVDMVRGQHYDYVFALITSIESGAKGLDYRDQMAAAFDYSETLKLFCCKVAGDANNDGACNLGDATYINNFVFKPGQCVTNPPIGCPPDCGSAGDANNDGAVNLGDATYINNFVFKPGQCATNPPIGCPPKCGPVK